MRQRKRKCKGRAIAYAGADTAESLRALYRCGKRRNTHCLTASMRLRAFRKRHLSERAAGAACFRIFSAAATSPSKSGCGAVGRDLNSGWNCPAMKYG